jgi:hypothetical protein
LFKSGRAEVLDSDQKALEVRIVGVDWSLVDFKVGGSHGECSPSCEPECSGFTDAFVVLESINLTPMKRGVDWNMITANRILKAGIYSQRIDESKCAQEDLEKLPGWLVDILTVVTYTPGCRGFVKTLMVHRLALLMSPRNYQCCEWPPGIVRECIAKDDGTVRQVRVRILSAKGWETIVNDRLSVCSQPLNLSKQQQLLGWTKMLNRLENSLQTKWVLPREVVESY